MIITTEIFADIDYSQDLRPGDSTITYERVKEDFVSTGRILAAEFINKSKTHRAALFPLHKKNAEYYSENGSTEESFPRTPVDSQELVPDLISDVNTNSKQNKSSYRCRLCGSSGNPCEIHCQRKSDKTQMERRLWKNHSYTTRK